MGTGLTDFDYKPSNVVVGENYIEINCYELERNWVVSDDWSADPGFSYGWRGEETDEVEAQGAWRFSELLYNPGDPYSEENDCLAAFFKESFVQRIITEFPNSKITAIELDVNMMAWTALDRSILPEKIKAFMLLPTDNGCVTDWSCHLSARHNVAMFSRLSDSPSDSFSGRYLFPIPESEYKSVAEDPTAWSTLASPPVVGVRFGEGDIYAIRLYFEAAASNFWTVSNGFEEVITS